MKLYHFKGLLFFLAALICISNSQAQTSQNWAWAQNYGTSNPDFVSVVTDKAGNVYTAGQFLSKHSPAGKVLWLKTLRLGNSQIIATGLAIDTAGYLYLTGYFSLTATFDTVSFTSTGGKDIFISKFDSNGQVQWAKKAGGPNQPNPLPGFIDDAAYGISVDPAGNSFITGVIFTGGVTVNFDGITIPPFSDRNFVAKYDAGGNIQWVRSISGPEPNAVSLGTSGSYYVAQPPSVLTKFNSSGGLAWQKVLSPGSSATIRSICSDLSGNCLITGSYSGGLMLDNYSLTPPAGAVKNMFLAKFNGLGVVQWARQSNGNDCFGENLTTNKTGQVYVTGGMQGTVSFGPQLQFLGTNNSAPDVFAAKYDSTGLPVWGQIAGGSGQEFGRSISPMFNGDCYIAGSFSGISSFGNNPIQATYSQSLFLAKLSANPLGVLETDHFSNLKLYPNPANAEINLLSGNQKVSVAEIYTLTGQQVFRTTFQGSTKLNVAAYPAGIYLIKISSEDKTKIKKLVISH